MKNYQRIRYSHYYDMAPNGVETEITRQQCFAPPAVIPNCPFKQRWLYDLEAGYVIRLPRNSMGEMLGKRNAADLKKTERAAANVTKHTAFELDKPICCGDDGCEFYRELEDETADVQAIAEDRAVLKALFAVLETLSDDDRELWRLLKRQAKKQEIADRFGITVDGVRYRENRLKKAIKSDPALKSFFSKD